MSTLPLPTGLNPAQHSLKETGRAAPEGEPSSFNSVFDLLIADEQPTPELTIPPEADTPKTADMGDAQDGDPDGPAPQAKTEPDTPDAMHPTSDERPRPPDASANEALRARQSDSPILAPATSAHGAADDAPAEAAASTTGFSHAGLQEVSQMMHPPRGQVNSDIRQAALGRDAPKGGQSTGDSSGLPNQKAPTAQPLPPAHPVAAHFDAAITQNTREYPRTPENLARDASAAATPLRQSPSPDDGRVAQPALPRNTIDRLVTQSVHSSVTGGGETDASISRMRPSEVSASQASAMTTPQQTGTPQVPAPPASALRSVPGDPAPRSSERFEMPRHQTVETAPRANATVTQQAAAPAPMMVPVPWTASTSQDVQKMDMTELRLTDVGAPSSRAELGQTTMQTAMPQRADLPAQVARQLAEALPQTQNRPVEITLSPEELGRVRLSLTLSESQVTVNLLAERPETLDLLRRHIDMLGEEFRALGYENIAFAFGGEGGSTSADTGTGQNADGAPSGGDAPDTSTVVALQSGAVTGLDLRL